MAKNKYIILNKWFDGDVNPCVYQIALHDGKKRQSLFRSYKVATIFNERRLAVKAINKTKRYAKSKSLDWNLEYQIVRLIEM